MNGPREIAFGILCIIFCGVLTEGAAETLSGFTQKSDRQLTAQGRLVVGRAADYKPSTEDEKLLSAKLKNSMLERRGFAWKVVEQMLLPTQVKLPEADTAVDVPRWQTWYEGSSLTPELEGIFDIYFRKLKSDPNANRTLLAEQTLRNSLISAKIQGISDKTPLTRHTNPLKINTSLDEFPKSGTGNFLSQTANGTALTANAARRPLFGKRQLGTKSAEVSRFCDVTNPTAGSEAPKHDPLTLRAQDGLERRFKRGTRNDQLHRQFFPLRSDSSTFGTIVSLASVWIATAQSFTPVLGA